MSARSTPATTAAFLSPHGNSFTRRPWREFFSLSALSRPYSLGEATARVKRNLYYFRVNYTTIVYVVLFLSLIYHPISMIIFIVLSIAWCYMFLLRDEPLRFFNRVIDDRLVLALLSVVTIVALVLSGVWLNVLVSILIGAFLVLLHGALRGTEDLYREELEASEGGLISVVGSSMRAGYTRV